MIEFTTLKASLTQIAKQASNLAIGLQNAAPHQDSKKTTPSVQYLFEIAEYLTECATQAETIATQEAITRDAALQTLTQDCVKRDTALREQYQIMNKFKFIHDYLEAIVEHVAKAIQSAKKEKKVTKASQPEQDEVLVYVYLFNAHGLHLETWSKMLTPAVFYEHSINRPIYQDKTHIENFVGRKPNPMQHGYLTIVVKNQDILPTSPDAPLKDMYGYPLIKVKEGSLSFKKCISFIHNGHEYTLTETGELIQKNSD